MDEYLSDSDYDYDYGYEGKIKIGNTPLQEEHDLLVRRCSKQSFQLDITDQIKRIEQETFPSQTRIASGHGILSVKICSAAFGSTHPEGRCLVKVSYVEPGEADNVLFRSKQVVFTTEETGHKGGVYCWNAAFEYDIHPPLVPHPEEDGRKLSDWNALTGDILFGVYDARGGKSNVFLGQTLLPLRGFVKGIGASIRGGEQEETVQDFILRARDGSSISHGAIHLELQLQLPPEEPKTPRASPARARKSLSRRTRELKGNSKHGSGSKDRHVEHLRYSRRRRARARSLRQEQICRENSQLNRRVKEVEATLSLPKGVRGRTRRRTNTATEDAQLRSEVLENITSARVRLNEINERKSKAKQSIVRSERLIKKLRQDVESIRVKTNMLPSKRYTRRAIRSSREKDGDAETTLQSDTELVGLRKRVVKVLRSFENITSRTQQLKVEAQKLQKQQARIKAEIEAVQSKVIQARRRRQSLANQVLRKGPDTVEVQLLGEIRALKVQAKLKEEEKVDLEEKHKRHLSRLNEEITTMTSKLQRKEAKIEAERDRSMQLVTESEELKVKIGSLVAKLTASREPCSV